jgi:hypothetical protein
VTSLSFPRRNVTPEKHPMGLQQGAGTQASWWVYPGPEQVAQPPSAGEWNTAGGGGATGDPSHGSARSPEHPEGGTDRAAAVGWAPPTGSSIVEEFPLRRARLLRSPRSVPGI